MQEESRGNPSRGSAETENTNKNEDDEELRSSLLQDVLEWLQDFKENLVEKNVQPHQYSPSSSQELPMEPQAKVVPGPGNKLYEPTEELFTIPLKYIDGTRTTDTTLDVMLEKHNDEYWNVDVDRELLHIWTVFTRFTSLSKKPPGGYTWSGEGRLTRKQTTSRPDKHGQKCGKHMSDASKRKEKQKWAIEKPKLDNARRLRGIYFIDPKDMDFKDIMKNAR